MTKTSDVIDEFASYIDWLNTLSGLDESMWEKSIATDKWSIKAIVLHIAHWDNHLLNVIVPAVKTGEAMIFPEFDSFNARATQKAKRLSGENVLQLAKTSRSSLIETLQSLSQETLTSHTTANGVTHCPHHGVPYTLAYIVTEFIEHDRHHQQQVDAILGKTS
ncbi:MULTISPECIES: DinB family protein [unclassified Exiguobacterium]|uniref:DinB family protein n=1 Tax=unclassified Exiguobacterium TaxID=2644629 RepID=UPI00103B11F4|nr:MULTISPECIES: DinB family protein [unclassified Exiguobacterium]TCI67722.1 ClbS/DfsB family four-helix bundle protein [Exiguobacterium sp. IPCI3]TCI77229.1 ClbS/DfsB family four-helix bundle protein [Exiguobacterium sp. IPCH1]TCI78788.1 ClbS/DfsB family four-helix bundle protein [Exiguobacterium sp. IPBC4]